MSLDIDWSLLSDPAGPSSERLTSSLAAHLMSTLNTHLSNHLSDSRPSFLGPIQIEAFDFGTTGPDVEITDVRDVWRAFDEDEMTEEVDPYEAGWYENEYGEEVWYPGPDQDEYEEYDEFEEAESVISGASPRKMGVGDVGMGFGLRRPDLLGTIPLSLGQASEAGYSASQYKRNRHRPIQRQQPTAHRRSSQATHLTHTYSPTHPPSPPARPARAPSSDSTSGIPSLQLHLHMSYLSDMTMTLQTSLQVNYPSSCFMALPLKLTVTGLKLDADIVLAYTSRSSPHDSKSQHRVHVSIIDAGSDASLDPDDSMNGYGYGHAQRAANMGTGIGQRILPELHIESEIGHADAHVLRNVGKVERFIADALRKVLVDELVFPNFHTIAI